MKIKRVTVMLVVGSLLCFISGCLDWDLDLFKTRKYEYTVEITPAGDGFERKLTCSKNVASGVLDRFGKLYGKRVGKYSFVKTFTSVPKDINESGSFVYFGTEMGSSSLYVERFVGDDDLTSKFEETLRGIDILTDLLIGWFEMELGEEPNFETLRRFCDERLRRDIKNMYAYLHLGEIASGERMEEHRSEFWARTYHYFAKRGYFDQIELSEIIRAVNYSNDRADYGRLMSIVQRFVAAGMGYEDADVLPESLGFLANARTAETSFEKYIQTTDLYKDAWDKEKAKDDDPNAEPPEAWEVVFKETGILDFSSLGLFADEYTYEVSLNCGSKPISSNGKWDEQTKTLTWSATTPEGSSGWNTFFYAAWSTPNKQFQTEHFGKLVLKGENLAEYCLWREGLSQEDAEEWDSFLLTLHPGTELAKKLASFRFSADPPEASGLAQTPQRLIDEGIRKTPARK